MGYFDFSLRSACYCFFGFPRVLLTGNLGSTSLVFSCNREADNMSGSLDGINTYVSALVTSSVAVAVVVLSSFGPKSCTSSVSS